MPDPARAPAPAEAAPHPAARAWRGAGGRAPRRVEVLKERGGTGAYRLVGAAPDGGDVIAKRCARAAARRELAVYRHALPRLPLPTLRLHGHARDGGRAWLFLEDAGGVPYDPALPAHRAAAGRWLAALHAVGSSPAVAARLPRHDAARHREVVQRARSALAGGRANPALPAGGAALLERWLERCARLLASWDERSAALLALPPAVVHGDLWPKNARVRATPAGPALLPFDWGGAGWGSPAADLAAVDVAAYRAAVLRLEPRRAALPGEAVALGRTLRALAAIPGEAATLASPRPGRALRRLAHYEAHEGADAFEEPHAPPAGAGP